MRQSLLIISFVFFSSLEVLACSCDVAWNDSFRKTAKDSEFVALVKILSFDEYLEYEFHDHEGKMPFAMTVEILKKYKGKEQQERIKIFGDNGAMCRPYLSEFEINEHYLISPNLLNSSTTSEYYFFSCRTEYLKVDINTNTAYGKYSMSRSQINLDTFENNLESSHWHLVTIGLITGILILTLVIVKNKKWQET